MICMKRGEERRSCLTSSHAATTNNELKYLIKVLGAETHKNHSSAKCSFQKLGMYFYLPRKFMRHRAAWKKSSHRTIRVMRPASGTSCVLELMSRNPILHYTSRRNQESQQIRSIQTPLPSCRHIWINDAEVF